MCTGRRPAVAPRPRRRAAGVDVERAGIDVDEDGRRALVEETVGRRHEAERTRDHLVPGLNPCARMREVERRGLPLDTADTAAPRRVPRPASNSAARAEGQSPERSISISSSSSRSPITAGRAG